MSRGGCLFWCGLLTAALGSPARGQKAADYRRRLDSLRQRAAVVNSLLDLRRASLIRISPRDTIRAGRLIVVVPQSVVSQIRPSVDSAWAVIDSTYGNSAAFLTQRTFALKVSDAPMVVAPGEIATYPGTLVATASGLIDLRVDSGLTSWLLGAYTPTPLERMRWDLLYVELATTPWSRIRECYADQLQSCRLALGLDGREDPITRWYNAEDRRRLASAGTPPPPLGAYSRISLLQLAITLGGRNAYDRLMTSQGQPIAIRLGLAAHLPTDSLVSLWRHRVMAARTPSDTLTARSAWTSLTWCLILGLLSLRSSRWR